MPGGEFGHVVRADEVVKLRVGQARAQRGNSVERVRGSEAVEFKPVDLEDRFVRDGGAQHRQAIRAGGTGGAVELVRGDGGGHEDHPREA